MLAPVPAPLPFAPGGSALAAEAPTPGTGPEALFAALLQSVAVPPPAPPPPEPALTPPDAASPVGGLGPPLPGFAPGAARPGLAVAPPAPEGGLLLPAGAPAPVAPPPAAGRPPVPPVQAVEAGLAEEPSIGARREAKPLALPPQPAEPGIPVGALGLGAEGEGEPAPTPAGALGAAEAGAGDRGSAPAEEPDPLGAPLLVAPAAGAAVGPAADAAVSPTAMAAPVAPTAPGFPASAPGPGPAVPEVTAQSPAEPGQAGAAPTRAAKLGGKRTYANGAPERPATAERGSAAAPVLGPDGARAVPATAEAPPAAAGAPGTQDPATVPVPPATAGADVRERGGSVAPSPERVPAPAVAQLEAAAAFAVPAERTVTARLSARRDEDGNRLTIELDPAELGSVEVALRLDDSGAAAATFVAERPETLLLLQRDSRALVELLSGAGFTLDANGLEFQLRDDRQNPPRQQAGSGGEASHPTGAEPTRPEAPTRLSAGRGLLDLRV